MRSPVGWLIAGALLFLAKLGVVLFGVNRGLDIGDEGIFLFALNDPLHVPLHVAFYGLLANFDPPLRFDLVEIRLLRVAVELFATGVLARSVFVWARMRFPASTEAGFAPFLVVGLLGSLLNVGARGFGYNDATNLVVFLASAFLFRLLATLPTSVSIVWAIAAGFAMGFQLFVKFPAALLLLAISAIGVVALPRIPTRLRLAVASSIGVGAAAAVGLFLLAGHPGSLASRWREAQELNRVAGYGVRDILAVYVWHDYASHVNGLRFATAAAIGFVAARRLARAQPDRSDQALTAALWLGAPVLAWGAWTLHAPNVHPSLVFLFCFVILVALVAWLLLLRRWRPPSAHPEIRRSEVFAPLLLLIGLPFVAMLGTNVALTLKLPTHVAAIFLFLALALAELARSGLRRFATSALALLVAATSAVFVEHQLIKPYGLPSPLYRQTQETSLLPGVRVDVATKAFLEDLHERMAAAGFEPGDPVIAFDFMPGLVYALGGRSPGLPFFVFDKPAQNCWAIERAELDEPPFLILGQDMLVDQRECIRDFAFPEQFRLVAALRNPYEAPIRYFFGGPPMPYVRVFAPVRSHSE